MTLFLGLTATMMALGLTSYAVLAPSVGKVALSRRRPVGAEPKSQLNALSEGLVALVDSVLKRRGWVPFPSAEIEMASLRMTAGSLVVLVSTLSFVALLLGTAFFGHVLVGLVLAVLVPIITKVVLRSRGSKRRTAFGEQLDESLQMIASALRAGHSLARALDTASREAPAPTSEEFARIVNENRIGRDLVEALYTTADRMDSQDFRWVAEAVAVQRDTGGNLNEVLDKVGATIRERNQILREVRTLSAEGRMSAVVLMVLPVLVALGMSVSNPGYMAPLFQGSTGFIVLGIAAFLFAVGGVWMRAIVNVKV
ncbi:type II secretion system F family protein [Aeromicrobium stalagmiti]|uniref:type II secretion system F family protein n=1 Tax=Aeromicrobium stalagmiti TaxID=2738988 RepID=UPI001569D587|nr:type II secretion system F family protein [Aeromicrobium stalagmiti]NRQ48291.1 type II secretion system F family protein [Aeromicrobium stalagmiti]